MIGPVDIHFLGCFGHLAVHPALTSRYNLGSWLTNSKPSLSNLLLGKEPVKELVEKSIVFYWIHRVSNLKFHRLWIVFSGQGPQPLP